MYTKDTHSYDRIIGKSENSVISFYFQLNQLKNLYRQGWIKLKGEEFRIKCESVADHSFSLAMLCDTIIKKYDLDIDAMHCLKMCMVHELGEIYAGDFTPMDGVSDEDKHRMEHEGVKKVLEYCEWEDEYYRLWEEYEMNQTNEAIFVKEVDNLEFIMQAVSYGYNISVFTRSLGNIKNSILLDIFEELKKLTINGDTDNSMKC
ncbi:MAG TPA: phosphodiesterase [Clostridiales bacterium]|nr:MAG: hypothetical protein A2Y18_06170 [Clostridiales bacterium GWD2_32_19]HCC07844.1 phosphodiesterase [Clostridiales bacterium]